MVEVKHGDPGAASSFGAGLCVVCFWWILNLELRVGKVAEVNRFEDWGFFPNSVL